MAENVHELPELARSAIASVTVLGALHASPAVKAAWRTGPGDLGG